MARFNNFSWQETLLTLWKIYYGGSFDEAGYEKAVIKHEQGAKRKQNATDNVKKIILERGQRCSRKLL